MVTLREFTPEGTVNVYMPAEVALTYAVGVAV
jgi:hypothetical protein